MGLLSTTQGRRFRPNEWGWSGFILTFWLTIILLVLELTNALPAFDSFCYDRSVDLLGRLKKNDNRSILLIESHPSTSVTERQAISLVEKLKAYGARYIVFTYLDSDWGPEFYASFSKDDAVILPREIFPSPTKPGHFESQPLLKHADGLPLKWGHLGMPKLEYGSFKQFQTYSHLDDGDHKNLESLVYEELTGEILDDETVFIEFSGPPGRLPQLFSKEALRGGLSPQLVKGRCVMIGQLHEYEYLKTPVSAIPMSLLEYRGNTLASLLAQRTISPTPIIVRFVVTIMLILASVILFPQLRISWSSILFIVFAVGFVGLSGICLGYYRIWLPLGHLLAGLGLAWGGILGMQLSRNERSLTQLSLAASGNARFQSDKKQFCQDEDFFNHLTQFVLQLLPANRMIIFERSTTNEPLARYSFRCSKDDYADAMESLVTISDEAHLQRKPVCLTNFFKNSVHPCYACPLVLAGSRLGTWVVEIKSDDTDFDEKIVAPLADLAQEIGELLVQKNSIVPEGARPITSRIARLFVQDLAERVGTQLLELMEHNEHEYGRMESLFDTISSATIVYDLFGRLLQINEQMSLWIQSRDLRVFEMTAVEFLECVSGESSALSRERLLNVVRSLETVSVAVTDEFSKNQDLILTARPLILSESTQIDIRPFNLGGIVFELTDVTVFNQMSLLRGTLFEQLGNLVRHDLSVIGVASDVATHYNLSEGDAALIQQTVQQHITHAAKIVGESEEFIEGMFTSDVDKAYPLDLLDLISSLSEGWAEHATAKEITLNLNTPSVMNYAFASHVGLVSLFSEMVSFLFEDSHPGGAIEIAVHEDGYWIHLHFSSHGYGIPDDHLKSLLDETDSTRLPEKGRGLFQALHSIEPWGGTFSGLSEVGKGYNFTIELRQFR
ncbi:hypothetical protein BVX99_01390 [bacterium F16]|nr:hypothetical protein BVX99_01390 [bacterium F16]